MPHRADKAAVLRRERSGSAPCCTRRADAAMRSAGPAPGRRKPCLQMDPLVQRPRLARVRGEIIDEASHAWVAPGPAAVGPDLLQRLVAKIAAHERQRIDQLAELG